MNRDSDREDLLRQIAELDRRITEELASVRLPDHDSSARGFPWLNWLLAAGMFAWWQYGDRLPEMEEFHIRFSAYGFYLGVVLGIIAIGRTVLWVATAHRGNAYTQVTENVQQLREQRHQLQTKVQYLDKEL